MSRVAKRSSVSLQFFEGAVWSAARNLLQAALSLTALAVVARELGPQAYGVFGIATLVIARGRDGRWRTHRIGKGRPNI